MARTTRLRRWLIAPLVCLVAGSLTTRSVPATASTGDWVNGNPVSALGPCGFGLVSRLDHFVSWYAKPGTEVSGALRYVKLTLENVGDCPIEPRQIRFFFGPHTRPAVDATNPTQCSVFNSATGQEGGALGCFVLDSMGGDEYGPIFLDAGKPIGLSLPVSFVLTLVIPVRTIWPDGGNEPFRVTVDDPGLSPVVTESSVPVPTVSGGVSIPPQPGGYTPVNPERLLETRPNGQTGYTGPRPGPGTTIEVQITGHAGIPTDATAAVLNITGTNAAGGYVTAYPCGTTRPNASNLNLDPGGTAPNLVITKIGTNGKVCLYTQNTTDLIADLNGWYPETNGVQP